MEREYDTPIIELGAVTTETQGPVGTVQDQRFGILLPGINDDE